MKTIAIICLIVLVPAVSFSEITERREISTSVSSWIVDEYGPISSEYFINDRFTPEQIAETGLGDPLFTVEPAMTKRTDVFYYRGYVIIVFYDHGYSRTVVAIDATLYMVESMWVFREGGR